MEEHESDCDDDTDKQEQNELSFWLRNIPVEESLFSKVTNFRWHKELGPFLLLFRLLLWISIKWDKEFEVNEKASKLL